MCRAQVCSNVLQFFPEKRLLAVGTASMHMYVKYSFLAQAPDVGKESPVRTIKSWNATIAKHVHDERCEEALQCLERMQSEGVFPNSITFVCCLKACRILGSIGRGREIHAEVARLGLTGQNVMVGNALVDLYAKCGLLTKAREVLDSIPARDIVSWTALIAGLARKECGNEALQIYESMQDEGVAPNAVTYVCCLKACGSVKALKKGREIHARIEKEGLLGTNFAVGNALVDFYVKCGLLVKAQEVFDKLPIQDVVSWTALIAGHAKHGNADDALHCFDKMQLKGVPPNAVTYVCCLMACGRTGNVEKGKAMHAEIMQNGLLKKGSAVGNALVDMYSNCGLLTEANEVFDKLPTRDIISWNALMSGYAKYERGEEALYCFEQMQIEGVTPDFSTLVCGLKACASVGSAEKGRELHAEISRNGFLERNRVVGSALVDMYAKCSALESAQEVFDCLSDRDVISWNALITGYAQHEFGEEVLLCFRQMQEEGVRPDAVTYVCSLKACGSIRAIDKGEEIHLEIVKQGLLGRDAVVGSALVDMYAKCGSIVKAQEVFDKLLNRDMVSWTALIAGYANQECGKEALKCFEQMQFEGIRPNLITFICGLKACCSTGAIDKGREIHAEVARKGLLARGLVVGSALVEMYAKGGLLTTAQELFQELPQRDINAWNVLISGYGNHEYGKEALHCFEQMQAEGLSPDPGTFVHVLNACCHADLVDKGYTYFEVMSRDYGISPSLEHHSCMVGLLSRTGHFDAVSAMIKKMPFHPNVVVWDNLLGACRKWGNMELGRKAFEEVLCMDVKNSYRQNRTFEGLTPNLQSQLLG